MTTGNEFLADYARRRNSLVAVVPSSIELADYTPLPEASEDEKFVICWTGSMSTLVHFEHARPALERLAAQIPLLVKVICSDPPQQLADRRCRNAVRAIVVPRRRRDVTDCHTRMMPLPDDEVSRDGTGEGTQFMGTGRPVVVSPVGVNADIVRSGYNGFLATTTDEWVKSCSRLREMAHCVPAWARTRESRRAGFFGEDLRLEIRRGREPRGHARSTLGCCIERQ